MGRWTSEPANRWSGELMACVALLIATVVKFTFAASDVDAFEARKMQIQRRSQKTQLPRCQAFVVQYGRGNFDMNLVIDLYIPKRCRPSNAVIFLKNQRDIFWTCANCEIFRMEFWPLAMLRLCPWQHNLLWALPLVPKSCRGGQTLTVFGLWKLWKFESCRAKAFKVNLWPHYVDMTESFEVRRLNSNPKRRWIAGTGPLAATLLHLSDLWLAKSRFGVS